MAWPNKVYVATTALGVYYTETFAGPSGGQPTWATANDGLPTLDCTEFALDPLDNVNRQYVRLGTDQTIYRREYGGAWTSILAPSDCDTLLGVSGCSLIGFGVDPSNGRLWATVGHGGYWAIYSDDHGDTWQAPNKAYDSIFAYECGSPRTYGDRIWFSRSSTNTYVQYSENLGATWAAGDLIGISVWVVRLCLNPLLPSKIYAAGNGTNGPDLVQLLSGTQTVLQADLGPPRNDSMWFSAAAADVQRLIRGGYIYQTDDEWDTINTPSLCSPTPVSVAPWSGNDEDQMILGLALSTSVAPYQNHVIGAVAAPSETAPVGLAGPSPDTSPYTDSIPKTCGGIAIGGVAAVYEVPSEGPVPPEESTITPPEKPGGDPPTIITLGGDVLTHAVAMPDYEGDARGTPLAGDRSAWDVIGYAPRHARDLKDNAPRYHVPEGDAVGDAPVWDGGKWVAMDVATQAELDAHEGEANPHGTELGDLADVDVATTPPSDGDALVWDDVAGEWVPANLVDQTAFDDHSARHENGGADEISVAGLSGVLADKQDADKIQGRDVAADAPVDEDVLVWNETASQWEPREQSGGGGGHEILDNGLSLPQRSALDFIGFDVADDDYGDATLVALPEGAYAETIGDGVETSYDVVHELGTQDVVVQVWDLDATPITLVSPSIYVVDGDTVRVTFTSAPDTDQMRVVVVKGGGGGGGGGGFANPMTTAGDIIVGGTGGAAGRLGIGTAGQVLTVNSGATVPEWKAASGGGIDSHDDSYGSPPASPSEGDLWVPNDSVYLLRRGATAWVPWGPIFPMVPPNLSDFTWVNQGTATADDSHGGIYMAAPATGGDCVRLLVTDAPSTPYTVTAMFIPCAFVVNYMRMGLAFRQSTDGKIHTCEVASAGGLKLTSLKWNHATSYAGIYLEIADRPVSPYWFRIEDDGTNRKFWRSIDGYHWYLVHSVGRTDFLTADQVGMFINTGNAAWGGEMLVASWEIA